MPIDLLNSSASDIQSYIDAGIITYERLYTAYIERIKEYDKTYNSIITINENAIEEAKKCDEYLKKNKRPNDIYCLPILVKDNIDVKGMPTTVGTKALSDSLPNENSKVVENLVDNGSIVIAKTNMSEFAFSASNSKSSYGSVRNVFNSDYTSYGSSGGSAVALKLSFGIFALGTDTNSSVRLPASAANVVGLRPTYDLVSTSGVVNYDVTRDVVGPMTKSVSENALLLSYMTGNKIDYTDYLKKDGLTGKTIGVIRDFVYAKDANIGVLKYEDKDIQKLFEKAVSDIKSGGANIVYLDNFYGNNSYNIYQNTIYGFSMCNLFNDYIKGTNSKIKNFNDLVKDKRYIQNLSEYNENCDISYKEQRDYQDLLDKKSEYLDYVYEEMDKQNIDVLVYPTNKTKILTLKDSIYGSAISASFTIAPVTGMPAISIPMGFVDGLSYGIEFVAKKNREDLLYEVTYSYEQKANNSKTPDNISNLYEINEDIIKLSNYVSNDIYLKKDYTRKSYKKYTEVRDEVIKYLQNYDGTNIDESKKLVIKYEKIVKKLKHKHINFLLIFIVLLIVYKYYQRKSDKRRGVKSTLKIKRIIKNYIKRKRHR